MEIRGAVFAESVDRRETAHRSAFYFAPKSNRTQNATSAYFEVDWHSFCEDHGGIANHAMASDDAAALKNRPAIDETAGNGGRRGGEGANAGGIQRTV